MNKIQFRFRENIHLLLIVIFCFLGGILAGSIYCGRMDTTGVTGVENYLKNFFGTFTGEVNQLAVFQKALMEYGTVFLVIFVCGFFKAGIVLNCAMVAKKGFVIGFTSASFFKVYAWKGFLACGASVGEFLIFLPAMVIFAAFSAKMALYSQSEKKSFALSYCLTGILFATIFCAAALWEGYLTTIFMKLLSSKLL